MSLTKKELTKINTALYRSLVTLLRSSSTSHQADNAVRQKHGAQGFYHFIPLDSHACQNLQEVFHYLAKLKNNPNESPRFIDVGSGMGNIMLLATPFFSRINGIELAKAYVNKSNTFFKSLACYTNTAWQHGLKTIHANILTFRKYHEYDVLYYYVPIIQEDVMTKAAERIADKMKVGAHIIPYGFGKPFFGDKRFKKLKRAPHRDKFHVYEKVKA